MLNDKFNFIHNGFVIESEKSYMTLEPTTCIIPYYAVESVKSFDRYVLVKLKQQLSRYDSFNKRIYRMSKENEFQVFFDDDYEKNIKY